MRSLTRLAAVTAAAAALTLGTATTALAASGTIDDKRYDVLMGENTLASSGTYAQRVASSNIDADKMVVNHGTNFVSLRVNFHKLDDQAVVYGELPVNGGFEDDYYFAAGPDGEGGLEAGVYSEGEGEGGGCVTDSETGAITGSAKAGTSGFIQLYIPRACLENPRYVRVGAAGVFFDYGEIFSAGDPSSLAKAQAEPTNEIYVDPINAKYFGFNPYTSWLKRG